MDDRARDYSRPLSRTTTEWLKTLPKVEKEYYRHNPHSRSLYTYLPSYLPLYDDMFNPTPWYITTMLKHMPKRYRRLFLISLSETSKKEIQPLLEAIESGKSLRAINLTTREDFKSLLKFGYEHEAFWLLHELWNQWSHTPEIGQLLKKCNYVLTDERGGPHVIGEEKYNTIKIHQAIYLEDKGLCIEESNHYQNFYYLRENPTYKIEVTPRHCKMIRSVYIQFFLTFHPNVPDPVDYLDWCLKRIKEKQDRFSV